MTTEEKIKHTVNMVMLQVQHNYDAGKDDQFTKEEVKGIIIKYLSSEIREAQIKMLEGLKKEATAFYVCLAGPEVLKDYIKMEIQKYEDLISELREEGKSHV